MSDDAATAVIRQLFGEVKDDLVREMRAYENSVRETFLAALDQRNEKLISAVNKALEEAVRVNTEHDRLQKRLEAQEKHTNEQGEMILSLSERLAGIEPYLPLLEHLQKLHS